MELTARHVDEGSCRYDDNGHHSYDEPGDVGVDEEERETDQDVVVERFTFLKEKILSTSRRSV